MSTLEMTPVMPVQQAYFITAAEAEQHEKLRKQLYDLVNEHGIIAGNGR